MPYTTPQLNSEGFNCPFCKAYSHQVWGIGHTYVSGAFSQIPDVRFALCTKCKKYSIWHSYKMVHPLLGDAPLPHPDLPYDIRRDYDEASTVLSLSPRSSAALLRLSIEKLTNHILKEEVGNLNENIKKLVDNGLPVLIQQSLDILRVIGNNALHPGQLDLKDDQQTALKLFDLVNLITDYMITKPQQTNALYQSLPEDSRKAIDKRDNKNSNKD